MTPKLSDVFPNDDFYPSEDESGKFGRMRKFRRIPSGSANPTLFDSRSRDFPKGAAPILCFLIEYLYPLLKTQLANAAPFENPDAYRLKVATRHIRKAVSLIPLAVPHLYDVFSKADFYHLLKTLMVNAEPYEHPDA